MRKTIYIDLETTGVDPAKNGVIQIAGIISSGLPADNGVEFNFPVRPFATDAIEEEALSTNRKTREEINLYPEANQVYKLFCDMLGRYCDKYNKMDKFLFIGYNSKFDADFLRSWFGKNNDKFFGSWFWNPPIDIMNLAMYVLKNERQNLPNFKLGTVASYLGIDIKEELHDALADIKITAEIESILRSRLRS